MRDDLDIVALNESAAGRVPRVETLTILGGIDKSGAPEPLDVTLRAGDVLCIVGATGAGKSRLLADVECLAEGDTPSRRRVLINGRAPQAAWRFSAAEKLVAQLSQTMNFVVDLPVGEFVAMHAECRGAGDARAVCGAVISCANSLAGEAVTAATPLTALSGGQTRALMIADMALLSASPIVLIDEIENAGVDRRRALDLLIAHDKIVLISTHDPLLALMGHRRLVLRHGAVTATLSADAAERDIAALLRDIDHGLMELRERLRHGESIVAMPAAWRNLVDPAWTR